MASIIQNLIDMVGYFTDVALSNPGSAVLLTFGTLFVTVSVAVFGYLTAGAVVDALIPDSAGRAPPQQG